ncbi:hypothetical protein DDB_G0286285 [Dictyostelium discoideum AX4]|uniref:Putative uncharacterized protein DDB_G0286285 n=1 Tax=Dictyostelium discoideum TaxID=44689 RepID=Y6905_DICDI|nr:hypothetical protein DDB_G0286285 [Dictyostelium discoideum AX4]Q54LZ8.1 RecName: Full=Putative uncharacterized protein DDB_G0286285 [Dictyostelium discoideum]EAL64318.1 hypothetical protein DDB_G0286285 [Dictyostelium discoideum AX4]|eukprot:XP_637833.1 hypothetical protein DDB_G0286285 [Dictyostelium discoideum AX4]
MNVKSTVLDLISSQIYKPAEMIDPNSTLGDQGATFDLVEIKGKLDKKFGTNIPMSTMNGKISGIISEVEKSKKTIV